MNQDLPHLRHWILPDKPIAPPRKRIYTEDHVKLWTTTQGYADYTLFYRRLNEAVVGQDLPKDSSTYSTSEPINKTVELLNELDTWVEEIPPLESPQRYGNLAFRDWGKRLEERIEELLKKLLPDHLQTAVPLLAPYLLQSFGSFTRMDYGSGHELAFALFLCSLTLIRFFRPLPKEEREIVFVVFRKYLQVAWKLQDAYKLEPAGSHGVWGLDDYHFLPFVWGSAQLRDHAVSRPPAVLERPLPETNLYYLSISRIDKLKTGPFHEHSPQLHSVATSVPTWWKVNQGMMKMYDAEVLAKRVVVQHIPLGAIIQWDEDDAEEEIEPPRSPPQRTKVVAVVEDTRPPAPSGAIAVPDADAGAEAGQTDQSTPTTGLMPRPGTSPRAPTSPMPRPLRGRVGTLNMTPGAPDGEGKRDSETKFPPLLSALSDEPEEMDGPLEALVISDPPKAPEGGADLVANNATVEPVPTEAPREQKAPPVDPVTTEPPKADPAPPADANGTTKHEPEPPVSPPAAKDKSSSVDTNKSSTDKGGPPVDDSTRKNV